MSEYDASNEDAVAQAIAAYEDTRREEADAQARSQYINFGILAVILLVVVLVVAVAAPFISQRIVAAVMGENLPQSVIINQSIDAAQEPEASAPMVEEEAAMEEAAAEETVVEDTAVDAESAAESEPTIHTVQQGETLLSISRQYGVDANDIIEANSIPNPENILVGTELTIPDTEN